MQDLAAYCEAREQVRLSSGFSKNVLTISIRSSLDIAKYGTPEISLLVPCPSKPKTVWLELCNGESKSVTAKLLPDGVPRLLVNVPTGAKAVHFRL
jgi:hypothetical protein